MGVEVSILVNWKNLRASSNYSEKHAGKPVVPLAFFLPVGIQASVND